MSHRERFSHVTKWIFDKALGHRIDHLADMLRAHGGQPIDIVLPDGLRFNLGLPTRATLFIHDPAALSTLAHPTLGALAEAFINGQIDIEGDITTAIVAAEQLVAASGSPVTSRIEATRRDHLPHQDRADIQHHYDVGNEFYRLWLDERMVYSCAYFETGEETIDVAQLAKLDHICRKLRLSPGERFLDIGCGWGGLIIRAAQRYGVHAVGITLSANQFELARERIRQAGLEGQAEVLLLDYRDAPAQFGERSFDKIASVGMFEHVGINNFPIYFSAIRRLLRDRGLLLNHSFTSSDIDGRPVGSGVSEFIDTYVFPNSELAHLHTMIRELGAQQFEIYDVESLRPHYARTLTLWSQRLEQQVDAARQLVGEKTLRIWRVYLAGTSLGFHRGWMNVYQVLASLQETEGPTELPLTRRWIYE
ncbi:MAG: class I SAM-dependent methyltransferase [Nitrospira sp.]|nr:class I SAM-dependent methyltransferase [Nitrospira sp.]